MEIIPHYKIYQFLEQLNNNHDTKINKDFNQMSVDELALKGNSKEAFTLYTGANADIKILLEKEGLIGNTGKISNEGKIFLMHYSNWWKRIELRIKDYPMFISSILSLLAILISIIALIISLYKN